MNNNIKKICFVLENCDSITLPKEAIASYSVSISRISYFYYFNVWSHEKIVKADTFVCELFNDYIKEMKTEWGSSIIDRLKLKDITSVILTLEDNQKIKFTVPWVDETRWTNILQNFVNKQENKKNIWVLSVSRKNKFRKYLKFLFWVLISPERIKNQLIFRWYDSIFYHHYRVTYVKISNYFYRKRKAKEGAKK